MGGEREGLREEGRRKEKERGRVVAEFSDILPIIQMFPFLVELLQCPVTKNFVPPRIIVLGQKLAGK